jgi:hypothetical protein
MQAVEFDFDGISNLFGAYYERLEEDAFLDKVLQHCANDIGFADRVRRAAEECVTVEALDEVEGLFTRAKEKFDVQSVDCAEERVVSMVEEGRLELEDHIEIIANACAACIFC